VSRAAYRSPARPASPLNLLRQRDLADDALPLVALMAAEQLEAGEPLVIGRAAVLPIVVVVRWAYTPAVRSNSGTESSNGSSGPHERCRKL
jgi:hypothetical protein